MTHTMVAENPKASFTKPHAKHDMPMPTSLASMNSALAAPHRSAGEFRTATAWFTGMASPMDTP